MMAIAIKKGPTEIWTRIIGFRVQGANQYTIGPVLNSFPSTSKYSLTQISEMKLWVGNFFKILVFERREINKDG